MFHSEQVKTKQVLTGFSIEVQLPQAQSQIVYLIAAGKGEKHLLLSAA